MKAIDIIEAITSCEYDLDSMGVFTFRESEDLQSLFGECIITDGNIIQGRSYLYWYNNDEGELLAGESPEAIIANRRGDAILLYEIGQ